MRAKLRTFVIAIAMIGLGAGGYVCGHRAGRTAERRDALQVSSMMAGAIRAERTDLALKLAESEMDYCVLALAHDKGVAKSDGAVWGNLEKRIHSRSDLESVVIHQ